MRTISCARVSFICPICNTTYEIFLRTQPQFMMIHCPSCQEFVSFYNGEFHILNEATVSKIKNIKNRHDVVAIINDINEQVKFNNKSIITYDDVINLKIELGQCKTFTDVMNVICKK